PGERRGTAARRRPRTRRRLDHHHHAEATVTLLSRPAPGTVARLTRIRTRPGRIRALAAAATVAVLGVLIVTFVVVGDARDGLRIIGHDAGPQVVATGDLYYALSDMDAQLASSLLIGGEPTLA